MPQSEFYATRLTIDALFLNEDRHMHNIAVLLDNSKKYHYCPIFDNGGALLSDTIMDYPMQGDLQKMLARVAAKTIHRDFDEQLDAAEKLYGQHIHFRFDRKDVEELLRSESYYSKETKDRVLEIVMNQRRKYTYLFT